MRGCHEVGCSHPGSGRDGNDLGALLLQLVVEGEGEHDVGQLRLLVARPPWRREIHGVERRATVAAQSVLLALGEEARLEACRVLARPARVVHDARLAGALGGLFEEREQLPGEQEVREVVRLHLDVVAILGALVVHGHNAGVVAQHIETLRAGRDDSGGGRADRLKVHQIAVDRRQLRARHQVLNRLEGGVGALRLAVQHQHMGALLSARARRRVARPRRGARDGDDLPGEVRESREDVVVDHVFLLHAPGFDAAHLEKSVETIPRILSAV
mmetsp:Transcript_1611/g.3644  ORF Transcript_1611/g.3644 Transcript_1611/m.3644 type:complete len:272 (+) Transcript_1611:440-1255(+)